MGFIEETGVAQHYRDVRITPIYEGTNGIQALDLLGRKLVRDQGKAAYALIADMRDRPRWHRRCPPRSTRPRPLPGICWTHGASDPARATAGATPYLTLFATVAGGWLMAKAAAVASERLGGGEGDPRFLKAKLQSAQFFADHVLPQTAGLAGLRRQQRIRHDVRSRPAVKTGRSKNTGGIHVIQPDRDDAVRLYLPAAHQVTAAHGADQRTGSGDRLCRSRSPRLPHFSATRWSSRRRADRARHQAGGHGRCLDWDSHRYLECYFAVPAWAPCCTW